MNIGHRLIVLREPSSPVSDQLTKEINNALPSTILLQPQTRVQRAINPSCFPDRLILVLRMPTGRGQRVS